LFQKYRIILLLGRAHGGVLPRSVCILLTRAGSREGRDDPGEAGGTHWESQTSGTDKSSSVYILPTRGDRVRRDDPGDVRRRNPPAAANRREPQRLRHSERWSGMQLPEFAALMLRNSKCLVEASALLPAHASTATASLAAGASWPRPSALVLSRSTRRRRRLTPRAGHHRGRHCRQLKKPPKGQACDASVGGALPASNSEQSWFTRTSAFGRPSVEQACDSRTYVGTRPSAHLGVRHVWLHARHVGTDGAHL